MRASLIVKALLLACGPAALAGAAGATYTVVDGKSSVRIHVGKSGALSFAGHRHEVEAHPSGTVTADPASLAGSRVELTFASGALRVVPEGEPAGDAPSVEEVMQGPRVLDVARFPEIRFRSKAVTGQALPGGAWDLSLVGDLTLHGVTKEVTIPVKVTVEGRTLIATARAMLRHDQFGMTPVSAGGGTVKVANEITLDLRIVAEQDGPAAAGGAAARRRP
jgi:polyisoprenoid-binding protein YceI